MPSFFLQKATKKGVGEKALRISYKDLFDSTRHIEEEYQKKFMEAWRKLGYPPTSRDGEYWEIAEWYRREYDQIKTDRVKEEQRLKRMENSMAREINSSSIQIDKSAAKELKIDVTVLNCSECGKDFERPVGRGRKPKRCPKCRGI